MCVCIFQRKYVTREIFIIIILFGRGGVETRKRFITIRKMVFFLLLILYT